MGCGSAEDESAIWAPEAGMTRDAPTLLACSDTTSAPEPQLVAEGLEVPWDLAFLPDGRILVVERPGRVRVIEGGELRPEPWVTFDVAQVAESGLLGIAPDPEFEDNGHVWLMGTFVDRSLLDRVVRRVGGIFGFQGPEAWQNRLLRVTDRDGYGAEATVVVEGISAGPIHAGGGLHFGPDGELYLGIGEGAYPERAQDPESDGGKVHRFDRETGELRAVAQGLRNPQRLATDPVSGEIYMVDHGPSGLASEGRRGGSDELNLLQAGANYGWPGVAGGWTGPGVTGITMPRFEWVDPIAPGGLAFVDDTTSSWHGDALVSALATRRLFRVRLPRAAGDPAPSEAAGCVSELFVGDYGRLRAVRFAPDNHVYFSTSNRDQRGTPGAGDDRLFRFLPPR